LRGVELSGVGVAGDETSGDETSGDKATGRDKTDWRFFQLHVADLRSRPSVAAGSQRHHLQSSSTVGVVLHGNLHSCEGKGEDLSPLPFESSFINFSLADDGSLGRASHQAVQRKPRSLRVVPSAHVAGALVASPSPHPVPQPNGPSDVPASRDPRHPAVASPPLRPLPSTRVGRR
jgi:hypothetical protein